MQLPVGAHILYLLDDPSSVKRVEINVKDLGDVSNHIAAMAGNPAINLPFIARSSENTPLHLWQHKDQATVYGAIKTLPLQTHWVTDTSGDRPVFTPVWHRSVAGSIYTTHHWSVPPQVTLYLIVVGSTDSEYTNRWKTNLIYMVAKIRDNPGMFTLPLANLFGDGRVCMHKGSSAPPLPRGALTTMWEGVWTIIKESNWNDDLVPEPEKSQAMFRIAGDGSTLWPADVVTLCKQVSNLAYDSLAHL